MDNYYQNKKILITGGCGFIGSNLAIKLVEFGAQVTLTDSMIPDYGGNLFNIAPIQKKIDLSFTDMRDSYAMRYLVINKDLIFNLAGQVSHIDSMQNPFQDLEINAVSQLQLLELCRYYNPSVKVVFTSTRQVYGKPQYLPVDENHPINPIDINGINNLAGEQYHRLYHEIYNIATVILRLTNTYGPRQLVKHNRQGFTGTFIRQAIDGKKICLFGGGEQKRDFNYVDDVVNAILLAGAHSQLNGKIYNLGGAQEYSLLEFTERLKEYCQFEIEKIPFPEEKKNIDIGDYFGNYSAFRKATGWEPQIDLKEGLKRSVEYYKAHKQHYWEDTTTSNNLK